METRTRTLVRIVVWRVLATAITAIWTGLETALAIHVVLVIAHYLYERLWLATGWQLRRPGDVS